MKKIFIVLILTGLMVSLCGCKGSQGKEESSIDVALKIYEEVYDETDDNEARVKNIVSKLGDEGHVSVDSENSVNMSCDDKLIDFIEKQKIGEETQIQVFLISYYDGFYLYEMESRDDGVFIKKTFYQYKDGQLEEIEQIEFEPNSFIYTEEGYLIIEESWHSSQQYLLTLSEEKDHVALRVDPLDEKYRELCKTYLAPLSYRTNNMFLVDWNKDDFSKLDFYDIFEKFYPVEYGKSFPYIMNKNLAVTENYDVPAEEFENVIISHMPISAEELRELAKYDEEKNCYIFRPRGFKEYDYSDIPYPEVVSYEENEDGSMTLLVNAVYPKENTSKLFSHKVTIKEIDGKMNYLSNEIIDNKEPYFWWHVDRLVEE